MSRRRTLSSLLLVLAASAVQLLAMDPAPDPASPGDAPSLAGPPGRWVLFGVSAEDLPLAGALGRAQAVALRNVPGWWAGPPPSADALDLAERPGQFLAGAPMAAPGRRALGHGLELDLRLGLERGLEPAREPGPGEADRGYLADGDGEGEKTKACHDPEAVVLLDIRSRLRAAVRLGSSWAEKRQIARHLGAWMHVSMAFPDPYQGTATLHGLPGEVREALGKVAMACSAKAERILALAPAPPPGENAAKPERDGRGRIVMESSRALQLEEELDGFHWDALERQDRMPG